MKASLKFEGARELERALAQLTSPYRTKKAGREALRDAAEPILTRYRAGTTVLTGDLVESETIGTKLNRRQSRLNRGQKMPVEIYVGTNDPAGIMEEFGLHNQAANPALRQAWDAEGGATALRRIGETMWTHIERQTELQARAAKRKAKKG